MTYCILFPKNKSLYVPIKWYSLCFKGIPFLNWIYNNSITKNSRVDVTVWNWSLLFSYLPSLTKCNTNFLNLLAFYEIKSFEGKIKVNNNLRVSIFILSFPTLSAIS